MLHTERCSPSPGAAQKQQTVCMLCGRAAVPSAPLQNMYKKISAQVILIVSLVPLMMLSITQINSVK